MSELYLIHHGIKGQKWGVRRFQNLDGSLTSEGIKRNDVGKSKEEKELVDTVRKKKLYKNLSVGFDVTSSVLAAIGAISFFKQLDKPEYQREYFNAILAGIGSVDCSILSGFYKNKYREFDKKE